MLTTEKIALDIAELVGIEPSELAPDDDLLDLGLDSVRTIELIEKWRAAGAEVEYADLADSPSLAAWSALLTR